MQHSWPAPMPPGRRPGTLRLICCVRCGGPLHHTMAKGHPRQEDHEQGCEAFIRAMRIMRYVNELNRSASKSAAAPGITSRRRRYLRKNAKKLTVAACAADPAAAIGALGDSYQAGGEKRREPADMADMLMLACRSWRWGRVQRPLPSRPPADSAAAGRAHGAGALASCWKNPMALPSGSRTYADQPMPGIGCLPWRTWPPPFWTRPRTSSMSATPAITTGALVQFLPAAERPVGAGLVIFPRAHSASTAGSRNGLAASPARPDKR